MIGYLLEQALENELRGREIVSLLTEVVVRPEDPAFGAPSKPVGPMYVEAEAHRLAAERGWVVAPDGNGFRRIVPSPEPRTADRMQGRIAEDDRVRWTIGFGYQVPIQ